MTRPAPILSDRQKRLVDRAANSLPPAQRETFLQRVARSLCGEPSDQAVAFVVNRVLNLTLAINNT